MDIALEDFEMWVSEIKPTLKGRLDTAACYQHLHDDLYAVWIWTVWRQTGYAGRFDRLRINARIGR